MVSTLARSADPGFYANLYKGVPPWLLVADDAAAGCLVDPEDIIDAGLGVLAGEGVARPPREEAVLTLLEVDFSAKSRAVRLIAGEALFQVAKDAARPFVVAAGDARVRAIGTAFNVRLREHM